MGTNVMRALLLTSASVAMVATAAPTTAYAQEASYQIDIPAQGMGDALRALGKATKQNIVFNGSLVKGKRSAAVRGRMSASDALAQMLAGSGLKMARGSGGGFVVQPGNAGAAPNSAPAPTRASQSQGRGTVTGTVKDETSGAALKGALVELVGTGRTTATDDLGAFRFANVAAGEVTVRIAYLGYIEQQSTLDVGSGETYEQDFTLKGGSGGQEIVVYGSRSARAQALNQERMAENTQTVVSADLLGHFDGATISEALRRVPGVAFEQDPVTGDGSNVIVRGLEPDFNTVTLNGLRLPEGSGTGRSANLSNILTDSISKVTISKTLLPNQDSSGTGGLIEIETKGPLDRPRRYASVAIDGTRTAKDFQRGFSANGTVALTFGADDNFGVSASVQYRKRNIERYTYDVFLNGKFPYLPLDAAGNPISSIFQLDPNSNYPFETGVDEVYPDSTTTSFNGAKNRNLAITLSGQWKIADHTNLRLDFVRSQVKRDEFSRSTLFDPAEEYQLMPIDELGGEMRAALVTQDVYAQFGLPGTLLTAQQNYSFANDVKTTTDNLSFDGETAVGNWNFNYSLGYTKAATVIPIQGQANFFWRFNNSFLPVSGLSAEAFNNLTSDGRAVSLFRPTAGNTFPVPLLSSEAFNQLRDPAEWTLDPARGLSISSGFGGANKRYTAKGDARYTFDSKFLKYIEVGGFYESARFSNALRPGDERYEILPLGYDTLVAMPAFGLAFSGSSLSPIGIEGGPDVIPAADIESLFANISDILQRNPGLVRRDFSAVDPRGQDTFTRENNLSLYVMPRVEVGKLEVVGGVRWDRVNIRARNLFNPVLYDQNFQYDAAFANKYSLLATGSAKQSTLLPRVAATWRESDTFLLRAAFSTAVARPRIQYLNGPQNLTFILRPIYGPQGNQPLLNVILQNPDLKPSFTKSFDFGVEKYFKDVGQVKISGFYKQIDNLLGYVSGDVSDNLQDIVIPDDPRLTDLSGFFIRTSKPTNVDKPARIYGVEIAVERQFTFLPGFLAGFGFYGNYTYTNGSQEIQDVFNGQNITKRVRMTGSPRHSGTAAITYNKFGIDGSISYTMQGRRITGAGDFGFDYFSEPVNTLDLRAEYRVKLPVGQWRFWFEGSDLLKGPTDAGLVSSQGGANGVPKVFTGGNYFGGRRATLGLSVDF